MNNLEGKRFGLLVVSKKTNKRKNGAIVWECICDCGRKTYVRGSKLKNGYTKSCGCLQRKTASKTFYKHGHGKTGLNTPTYKTWANMLNRCNNPNNDAYKNYGGRGITVCDEWKDFANFLADMGERPDGTSIDRINVNLGYYKVNCRWATASEQLNNKRNNPKYNYKGESLTITQLADRYGVKREKLYYRIKHGWSVEKAIYIK